ncbi:glycosyl transferase group 1 [Clostridium sp. DL-VIII]|uniref:glycosyltransferase family 4 protein n=1 Tax=Clostridium sp. DL-VIII TaxID=641107 RepID=UPI00023B07C7|nr:glycosyltransferase family 4 protein [Clostridium sp. DL-VIII]EHJ01093.1 glycosyl transferase group 1 [Clostridium sp. DL-VIII]
MKILITTDTYSPIINGVVTSINNLYRELKCNGHEVKILTLSNTGDEKIDGDVYYLKSIKVGIYPDTRIINIILQNGLIKKIIKWKPDVVHSQTEFSMMLVSKYISRKLNIPHIHTYHTMYENYLNYLFKGKIINRNACAKIIKVLLNSLDSIIAPTEKTRDTLVSYGVKKPIYVVPTGIDLSRFKQELSLEEKQKIMSELNINRQDRIIAYIGRIGEEKNISELIRLMPGVIKEIHNVKLLIVGGGPYLNNLKSLVKKDKIEERVIFTGMINPEEIYKYYKIAEVFVTASFSETQGLTYVEALSSGCPVVCKYDPCINGVIEQGENGFSYKEKDEFAHYIKRILSDIKLRDRMSKEAVINANKYSSDSFARSILDKYFYVINANRESSISVAKLVNPKPQK